TWQEGESTGFPLRNKSIRTERNPGSSSEDQNSVTKCFRRLANEIPCGRTEEGVFFEQGEGFDVQGHVLSRADEQRSGECLDSGQGLVVDGERGQRPFGHRLGVEWENTDSDVG